MGTLVSETLRVNEGVFEGTSDRVNDGGGVKLAVSSDEPGDGTDKDVVGTGKLDEPGSSGNEALETELAVKEDSVAGLLVGMNVVLGDRSDVDMDSIEDSVGTSFADNEVTTESILEKLVVSTFARSLVDIPLSVVKVGAVRFCVVEFTDPDGSEKSLLK